MATSWLRRNALMGQRMVVSTCGGEWWVRLRTGVGVVTTGGDIVTSFLFIVDCVSQRYLCFLMSGVSREEEMESIVCVLEEANGANYGAVVSGIKAVGVALKHFRLEYMDFSEMGMMGNFAEDGLIFFNGANWQFLITCDLYEVSGCIMPQDGEGMWLLGLVSCTRSLPIGREEEGPERLWMSVMTVRTSSGLLLETMRETDWSDLRWSWQTVFPMRPTELTVWEQVLEVKHFGGAWLGAFGVGDCCLNE
jgi:hypothetical protein